MEKNIKTNENFALNDKELEKVVGAKAKISNNSLASINSLINQKITSQSDDPAGYQISERMRVQIRYNDCGTGHYTRKKYLPWFKWIWDNLHDTNTDRNLQSDWTAVR